MAREISLLIPDEYDAENLEIKVFSAKKEILKFRLELIDYDKDKVIGNRADYVKRKIDEYDHDHNYILMDVGIDENNQIPLLFQYQGFKEENKK